MVEHEGFLHAILEAPQDDTLRLVYATAPPWGVLEVLAPSPHPGPTA
jgi:hypothetical protein